MGTHNATENRAIEEALRQQGLFPHTSAPWQQDVLEKLLDDLSLPSDSVCLDAACGIGNNIHTLNRHCNRIIAFDRSVDAIAFAKERHQKYPPGTVSFYIDMLTAISQRDNSFDCVVCTEALEHLKDYETAISEIFRVTKTGGYAILSFQNHVNLSAPFKFIFEKIYGGNWDVWGTHGHEEGYESYLTCFQIKKAARRAGFIPVKGFGADYINAWLFWIPFLYKNYKILDAHPLLALGRIPLIKYLGMDYFMLLRKPGPQPSVS